MKCNIFIKKPIKNPYVKRHNTQSANPPRPSWTAVHVRFEKTCLTAVSIGLVPTFPPCRSASSVPRCCFTVISHMVKFRGGSFLDHP